jgi:hypothetical protein
MNGGDWLRLLNAFVFFFTSSDRPQALRSAYPTTLAVLLTVRPRSLVQEHGARVRLAGMTPATRQGAGRQHVPANPPLRPARPPPGGHRHARGGQPTRPLATGGAAARRRLKRHRQLQHRFAPAAAPTPWRRRPERSTRLSVRSDRDANWPSQGPQPCACVACRPSDTLSPRCLCRSEPGAHSCQSPGWPRDTGVMLRPRMSSRAGRRHGPLPRGPSPVDAGAAIFPPR